MSEAPDRTETVFAAAVALAGADERAAYLDQACAGDAALRGRVEALLRAHQRAGHLLDRPAPGGPELTAAYAGPQPGSVVAGRYKLLEQIGEGGMGAVWVAEQTQPVRRKVALKLIKAGMDTKAVLARFEAERQALAVMDHPNIAKVLDGGVTEQGRPFFVMEYVKGVPITEYSEAARLSVPQRLELFVQVCAAVQHAHQKGIIHRDLKPSNILVAPYDDKPVPKVIDFGLAKALHQPLTERTLHTAHETVLGTPLYMSPEQAQLNNLDVDTRSDVYSLGVLLYELLTGTTPLERRRFKEAAWEEVKRLIREEEPPRPSARLSSTDTLPSLAACRQTEPARLTRLVRGELDWIVMKALEKDRSRRYQTASGLAADVGRHLAGEPVQAAPPGARYRLRKFARRHRGPVLAAAGLLLLLVAGVAGTTWGLVRAERARAEAERARQAEAEQRRRAEANEGKALGAAAAEKKAKEQAQAREAETRAVLEFVEGKVFAAARPRGLEGGLGPEVTLRRAMEAALPFVADNFRDRPLIEARLRYSLGLSFWHLGEARLAAEQFRTARTLYAKHRGPDHPDTLASMHDLANAYSYLGRHTDALKLREETLALYKARLGPGHPGTLGSMNNLANSYHDLGRHADALKLREETLALYKARLGPDHPDTLMSMDNLANSYRLLGRQLEALKLREEILTLRKTKLGPDHPDTLLSMHNLANNYDDLGRPADALKLREETLALRKTKLGPDHPLTLSSMGALASSYDTLGRHTEAVKLGQETLALMKAKLGPDHPDTLLIMNRLANSYEALGWGADALKLREEALPLMKAQLGPDHPDAMRCMNNLASSYFSLGRHAEALKLNEQTLALRKAKLGPNHPDTLWSGRWTAEALVKLGRGAEAVPLIDECVRRAAGQTVDPNLVPAVLVLRLRHFEKSKDAAGCRATAEMWEGLGRTDVEGLYNAACWRAVTAAALRPDGKSEGAANGADAEAERAVALLRQAVAAGFKDADHLKRDRDLDALRGRDDFRKLLAGLEAGQAKDNKPGEPAKPSGPARGAGP